jgi:hypothetical protein
MSLGQPWERCVRNFVAEEVEVAETGDIVASLAISAISVLCDSKVGVIARGLIGLLKADVGRSETRSFGAGAAPYLAWRRVKRRVL